jgi:integrase
MQRIRLTPERIRKLACPPDKDQDFLADTESPGLKVRVTRGGAKSFIFESKLNRKTIRVTVGSVRSWPIESGDPERPGAREEARRLQTLIDQGIDPRLHRAEKLAENEAKHEDARRRDVTLSEAWAEYITDRRDSWGSRHLIDHERLAHLGGAKKKRGKGLTKPGALAALMPLRLEDITRDAVKEWLRIEKKNRATQARIGFGALRAFLMWCGDRAEYRGMVDVEACAPRVAREILPRKRAKADNLLAEQLPVWFAEVRKIGSPVISAYLQALLLTGARREELAALTWDNIDFQWKTLTIRDKVDGQRVIPLTPYVAALLDALPRRADNAWVFSSPAAKSGRLQEPRIPHNRALAAAGLPPLSLHGLRRSFATLSEWTVEVPAGVVAQIMGHKPSATAEKHYRVRPLDLLRQWHVKIEKWILEKAGIEQPAEDSPGQHGNVVKLRGKPAHA